MKTQNAEEFAETSSNERNKDLAKIWRELPKEKKDKLTKGFENVI